MADAAISAPFAGFGARSYRAYVLAALLTVYTFNFIDRVVISIIQEPIRHQFHLNDFQLGLLGGPTFAILYTLLGIPIARLAERKNRTTILSLCIGLWSVMTALCGLAVSYPMLLLARIGVSIGEAGCTPSAQSIISDYFPSDKRSTAVSIYALGVPLGSMLAAIGGGFIAQYFGWQKAFLVLGVPGLILAIIFKLTVKEPPRVAATEGPGFGVALAALARKSTFWNVAVGSAAASFTGYGVGQFTNSFFMRSHDMSLLHASQITGLLVGLFGGMGTFACGFIADKIIHRHPNALAWLPALGFIICTPLNIAGYLTGSLPLAVALLALALMTQYFYLGSMYAIAQGVVHPRMRATSVAILLFVVNIIGYGAGPPVIGAISDIMANMNLAHVGLTVAQCKHGVGVDLAACASGTALGLRYAIVIGFLGYLWAAAHFLFAWRTLQRDWEA